MVADDHATQGGRISVAMILTLFARNIPVSTQEVISQYLHAFCPVDIYMIITIRQYRFS